MHSKKPSSFSHADPSDDAREGPRTSGMFVHLKGATMLKIIFSGSWLLLGLWLVLVAPTAAAQTELFEGKPEFKEGTDMGYYIWREGDTWKLRWTTTGALRHFTGHVTAEGGELKSLKRIDVETERKVL